MPNLEVSFACSESCGVARSGRVSLSLVFQLILEFGLSVMSRYTRKVKRLFQTIDDSGDGAINFQEFSKLVQSPKLKFWMSQLDTCSRKESAVFFLSLKFW